MAHAKIKRFFTEDGIVHWGYAMTGRLTVCGKLAPARHPRDATDEAPTCFPCIAMVQAGKQGVGVPIPGDPTRKLG